MQSVMAIDVCTVTFDQPLYAKAREIVAAAPEGSDLSKIVIRLGGFHLLISFFWSNWLYYAREWYQRGAFFNLCT